ncbi:hypothetical protein [Streptomyces sp. NPDC020298]|uniref:hypothetical protein n=1 Tax=unclassified Streptomyces TaxID=2593676 RepID=UPI0033C3C636
MPLPVATRSPSTTRSTRTELALSATVSTSVIFQSRIRLSTISTAGATASVAPSTSSTVTPGPRSGSARRKQISGSMRGAQ